MKYRFSQIAGVALLLMAGLLCAAAAGPGCSGASMPSTAANKSADDSTRTWVSGVLDDVAKAHPDQAAAVKDVETNWATRSERDSYNAAKPLLSIARTDKPGLADVIDQKLWSWNKRLTTMGQ